jgi:hypothetical protein
VAIARDVNTVAVGADNADLNSSTSDSGALYIFRRS